ncbi:MAG TPA: hypothetical protein VGL39_13145 [Jatrophihabitantaceae bacterium]|jgi:hypothetical protein
MPNDDGTQTNLEKAQEEVRQASRAVDEARTKERVADGAEVGSVVVAGAADAGTLVSGGALTPAGVAATVAAVGLAGADVVAREGTNTTIANAEAAEGRLNAVRAAEGLEPVDVDYEAQARPIETPIVRGAEAAYDTVAEGASDAYDLLSTGASDAYTSVSETASETYTSVSETASETYDSVVDYFTGGDEQQQ